MSTRSLLIEVHLFAGRYHGVGDWPPSPFRVFQALVAGAYGGRWIGESRTEKDAAFRWLERQSPPTIAAPSRIRTRAVSFFVPNNDLDAMGGDPARVSEIRTKKQSRASLFAADEAFLYAWPIQDGESGSGEVLCALSERLHTLGRGIDPAFARASIVESQVALGRLQSCGRVSHPGAASKGQHGLRCPAAGSFDSLIVRFDKRSRQLHTTGTVAASAATLFRQPPKALCTTIQYEQPPVRLLFDIRSGDRSDTFRAIRQVRAVEVSTAVRDIALRRLTQASSRAATEIEQVIAGRGTVPPDPSRRVRIVPLASIGSKHANHAIRRVLLEVPWNCPIPAADVAWAVSGQPIPGLGIVDDLTGELRGDAVLVPTEDDKMLAHYGVGRRARKWATVTPAALPLHPARTVKTGGDRAEWEGRLALSVINALRHAGLPHHGLGVRVQREPFHPRGATAQEFASGRFSAKVLHHVEVLFPEHVAGPVVIGDGRWLGLGILAPVANAFATAYAYRLTGGDWRRADTTSITRAIRRAVLARAGALIEKGRPVSAFFSGHERDGRPVRRCSHGHLFYLVDDDDRDGLLDHLVIAAPELADRTAPPSRHKDLSLLERALDGLEVVRAGRVGVLNLSLESVGHVRLLRSATTWESVTEYRPTRHPPKSVDLPRAVITDVLTECSRRGLPVPTVELLQVTEGHRGGLYTRIRLSFAGAVRGPLVLGADSHFGQGLFSPVESNT